ncbi:ABC transporter ATP-binding protein [Streptomyces sp. NPDC014733]|uniref:ABC transporter ATP-binding protein n=1 Tax=Streptomyces sp. NPDC014733 TaxID=3364885 RepID=UPI0036F778E2
MTTAPAPAQTSDGALPIASPREARRAAGRLIRRDRRAFALMLGLNALAAAAGLAGPWLLGRIVDTVRGGGGAAAVDRLTLLIVAGTVLQLLLGRFARYAGHRFGERALARVREGFVDRALALPSAVVERAGTGDLTARGTTDVAAVAGTLRDATPEVSVAVVQALFLLGAVVVLHPLLGACALGLTGCGFAVRWYLRRARTAYLDEGAAVSELAGLLAATAAGARTIDLLGLADRRAAAARQAIERSRRARLRTLFLRSVLFPVVDFSYTVPVAAALVAGGALHDAGVVSLGAVVSAAVLLGQLSAPLDTLLFRTEQLQAGAAAFARVEGVGTEPDAPGPDGPPVPGGPGGGPGSPADATAPPAPGAAAPRGRIEARGVRYAYPGGAGDEVLRGVELTVRPGERLALVGPSGAGKSTLGRLLAGIEAPRAGTVTVGGVPVAALPPQALRRQVALVTQEHHVFLGTVRDNLRIAAPDADDTALHAALAAVGAEWAAELPSGLATELGPGGFLPDGARSQQLSLARVVLADPGILILDEATALLDPRTARRTERALAAVLEGRTVIAVAHRLHTAHDADRVAVMEAGRITELGTHDALVAAGGAYAALWRAWHGDAPAPPPGRPAEV